MGSPGSPSLASGHRYAGHDIPAHPVYRLGRIGSRARTPGRRLVPTGPLCASMVPAAVVLVVGTACGGRFGAPDPATTQ